MTTTYEVAMTKVIEGTSSRKELLELRAEINDISKLMSAQRRLMSQVSKLLIGEQSSDYIEIAPCGETRSYPGLLITDVSRPPNKLEMVVRYKLPTGKCVGSLVMWQEHEYKGDREYLWGHDLRRLFVEKKYRRKGIASKIMEATMKLYGRMPITLDVEEFEYDQTTPTFFTKDLVAFYRRYGFRTVKTTKERVSMIRQPGKGLR